MHRRHLCLVALLVLGCSRPSTAPPAPGPAPAVTFSADPAPASLFAHDNEPDCAVLGTGCAAPYLRLAATMNSPVRNCEGALSDFVASNRDDMDAKGSENFYSVGAAWSEATLSTQIADRLGLDRWRQDRPLTAYGPHDRTQVPGGERATYVLHDPVFGGQRLLLYTPESDGPHHGVLGLPGHQESPEEFMALHGGYDLLRAGYTVLLPVFKAYDAGHAEDAAGRALLCMGSSLLAARVAEAASALRMLRSLPGIRDQRVAVIGHSGGSMVGNLLLRLDASIVGYVSDMTGVYLSLGDRGDEPVLLMDESHAGIRVISDRVARFPSHVLQVDYGLPTAGADAALFFDLRFGGHGSPAAGAGQDQFVEPAREPEPPPDSMGAVEDLGDIAPEDTRANPPPGGTLSLAIEQWMASPGMPTCRDVAAADLDGDGKDELALATDDAPDVVWTVRDGALTKIWTSPSPTIARGVSWADADGDGDPDLAFGVNNGAAPVFRNDGGTLVPWWSGRIERLGKGIAWADLDGDGDPDLAIADSAYDEFIRNDGGFTSWHVSSVDRRHEDAVAVDIDGDGQDEVAFAVNQPGFPNVEIWGLRDGSFQALPFRFEDGPRASALAFADVDGDGKLDVAVARPGDRDTVLLQDGGAFKVSWTSGAAVQTRVLAFWDADRDGDPDLVLGEDGPLALYENRGGQLHLAWRSAESDDTEGLTTADVDGDGVLELVTCAQKGAPIRVYRAVKR